MAIFLSFVLRHLLMIWALFKKELIVILMDPGSRKVLVVPIVMQSVIFGYGANFQLNSVPYVAFNASPAAEARQLMHDIELNPLFESGKKCLSLQCVEKAVGDADALAGIYIAPDFSATRQVNLLLDARHTASANTAALYIQQLVSDFNDDKYGKTAVRLETRKYYNENNSTRFSIMTGMILALSIIQVVMLASLEISREREEGSFDMMLMTPASSFDMLLGKALPPVMVALFQSLLLTAICVWYFNIPFIGSVLDLTLVILMFALACVGIGLVISVLSKTTLMSIILAFLVVMPSILVSGMLTPVDAMPAWFRPVAWCNPLYYGVEAVWRVYLEGESLEQVTSLMIPLMVIACITFSVAGKLFRSRLN